MMMMMSSNGDSSGCGSSASSTGGEFEVARVLAGLRKNNNTMAAEVEEGMGGSSVGCGSGGGGGGGQGESVELGGQSGDSNCWGSKGKRWMSSGSSKRVKEASSLHFSPSLSPLPFDLNDQPNVFQDECQNVGLKAEETCESAERGRACNPPHDGGRSRHNLNEAEKEARRIRRILANRESARQTIRRRQAFHEELTRKSAELASENERLKRSKELAVKEYQSLESTNQNLKGQLSQTLGFKLGEIKGEGQSSCPDTNNLHSSGWAQFMYKKLSASPSVFPECLPPSDVNVSHLSQQFCNPRTFAEQDNAPSINGQNVPWCILPCPVFLPIPDIKNFSSFLLKDSTGGTSADSKHVPSPSSVISCLHNCPLVRPADKKSRDVPSTQDECRNGFYQNPFGLSLDKGCQQIPQLSCCLRKGVALERENYVTPHSLLNTDVTSATGIETENAPEKRKESILRKREISVAGAEARRKRKELMKLKSGLHCHLLGQENG